MAKAPAPGWVGGMICDEVTCVSMLLSIGNRFHLAESEPQVNSSPCRFCCNVKRQSFSDTWEEEGKEKKFWKSFSTLKLCYVPVTFPK